MEFIIFMIKFGLYRKQFIFYFLIFALLAGVTYFIIRNLGLAAPEIFPAETGNVEITIEAISGGKILVNGKQTNGIFHLKKEFDELRYIPVDNFGEVINFLEVKIILPKEVGPDEIRQRLIAVHGVEQYDYFLEKPRTLIYRAAKISPSATITVIAEIPKNILVPSLGQKILFWFSSLSPNFWLGAAVVLPLLTLFILIFLLFKNQAGKKIPKPQNVLSEPPSSLNPALVGVLIEGKVNVRAIASILFDLVARNFLVVVKKGEDYHFSKKYDAFDMQGRSKVLLKPYEANLLDKIFLGGSLKTNPGEILARVGRHIFSRKVAEVYLALYEEITSLGFFIENPSKVQRRYRALGLLFFFFGIAGFITTAVIFSDLKYILFFWAGMIFASTVIYGMARSYPVRTLKGTEEASKWLAFREFLADPNPIGYQGSSQQLFQKYLSYAVALGVEVEWAKRFLTQPFIHPDWFVTAEPTVDFESFVQNLFPLIGFIARSLAIAKEPTIG